MSKWKLHHLTIWIENGCDLEIAKKINILDLCHNNLFEIPKEIKYLINLEYFFCDNNNLSEIPREICNLINLRYFRCYSNKIQKIPNEIGQLVNLEFFGCGKNKIKHIPPEIMNCVSLRKFDCTTNEIKQLPIEIINCENLTMFYYTSNEIEYIQPSIKNWLNRYKNTHNIYNDNQSIYNNNIQQCVLNSINYIMQITPKLDAKSLMENIANNNILEEKTKQLLFEYCNDKFAHNILNITFEELLISIYDFILNHKNKDELFAILNDEMINNSSHKCFTGRMSCLINTLNGFDNNIIINISDMEQINNICAIVKKKLESANKYSNDSFKKNVKKELQERNYDETIINESLDNIDFLIQKNLLF
ncbi:leucine rich repeat protein [Bodo saltans virus]|uniref:Leucine rich repeat protein n=1 Tax=Bodo saltans virus TaxID=2024608 RepID=A0A2H4UUS5_9VIRU|nr:leucine rich repeat protein [Bodo saltans virus]ATZ80668.1 leucine rich repeat protein [Bodo saltans virus]